MQDIAIVLLLSVAWFRRSPRSVRGLCATIAITYLMFYGISDNWSFQYFAWGLPFWFFLGPYFFVPAVSLGSAYIYSLYWLVCGDGLLRGTWDFMGHPHWPPLVLAFPNLAFLFFFFSAMCFLVLAIRGHAVSARPGGELASG